MITETCSERDLIKRALLQFSLVEAKRALQNCLQFPDKILLTGEIIDVKECMY